MYFMSIINCLYKILEPYIKDFFINLNEDKCLKCK